MADDLKLEDALKRLAEIVRSLEQNECALEDSLKLFEEGVGLTRACHAKLTEAERRIEILSRVTAQGVETKPLNPT
jgi:exodeoxyribonuclease VII small subunit